METTVTILRELWQRRIYVGVAAGLAILVGVMLAYRLSLPPETRQYDVGIATTHILVDTPQSQVVDVSPKGSGSLGSRANLLANLMTEGDVKAAIARRAGLRPNQLLAGVDTGTGLPPDVASAAGSRDVHLLTTRPESNSAGVPLPIIELDAQAPDPASASRLASAAVAGLRSYLDSRAASENVSAAHRLDVRGLGEPQVTDAVRGPRHLVALGAAVFVFLLGCAAILIAPAIARTWRAVSDEDAPSDDERDRPDSAGSRHRRRLPWSPLESAADPGPRPSPEREQQRGAPVPAGRHTSLGQLLLEHEHEGEGEHEGDSSKAGEQPSAASSEPADQNGQGGSRNGKAENGHVGSDGGATPGTTPPNPPRQQPRDAGRASRARSMKAK